MTIHTERSSSHRAVGNVPTGLHINGAWIDSPQIFDVLDPASGEVIAQMTDADPDQAMAALDAAVAAQKAWATWSPKARADLFHHGYQLLISYADEFAAVMTAESGKPLAEARAEFALSASFFRWYAEQISHLHGTFAHGADGSYRVVTTHQPVGPCYLITPWNFPLLMSARKAGAALAAGCTVVVKSANDTPLTAALFVRVLAEAGFPAGVVNLVHTGNPAAISDALLGDARLRKLSFTGSTAVGSTLLRQAADNVVNSSMELGGDGPFIVLDDADIDLAVEQAVTCKFRNAGQACVAANRIILHSLIADEFTEKFVARVRELRVGNGFDDGTDIGPIINARQRDRVVALVATLRTAGAEVLLGGGAVDGPGYFYEPTVLQMDKLPRDLCGQEMFAPIAVLFRVDSVLEAIEFANDTPYGLAAYVFSSNIDRAIGVAERLESGMVGINRGVMADPAASFGGVKGSGLGREGGQDGIYEFLEPQYLAITVNQSKVEG